MECQALGQSDERFARKASESYASTLRRSHVHVRPGMLRPAVTLPISAAEVSLALARAWFAALRIMSSNNCASAGLMACGSILTEASVPSHLATIFTAPPPLVASTVRLASSCWIRFSCFRILAGLGMDNGGWWYGE